MKPIGIILIVAGILMLIFRSVSFTEKKKIVDLGPVEINKDERKTIGWPIYAGGAAIVAGALILVVGTKKK